MAVFDYDLGILGGGAGGLTAAAGAARFGAKTVLIEKAKALGGDCLHYGCVPSKTLIRTAGVWSLARRAKEFGLPELDLPAVSLAAVMARVRSVIDKIQAHDSPERFCRLGAAVRFGSPRFIDDHTVSVDGDRLTARAWIVATGSSPALPPVEGLANVPYWTNETVFSQTELPGRLIVLGGGPIGCVLAQAFARPEHGIRPKDGQARVQTKQFLGASILGIGGDEIIHSILDLMYAKAPYTVIQRAMHIHPTVSEFIPAMMDKLKPLQRSVNPS